MRTTILPRLALTLAIVAALGGCQQKEETPQTVAALTAAQPGYVLDESTLPPMNSFLASDIDTSGNACTDFGSYINKNWLAAHPIPSDRTSWGAFEMLSERSTAVQHQIAEQAAAKPNASGIDKIIGDFYATGMDQAKIEAQGIQPIEGALAEIAKLDGTASIAEYLRQSYAKGEGMLFGFGPEADFKNSSMNIAYATQGGLGLPDKSYYIDADKKDKLDAYQAHVAKVLALSGIAADDAANQAAHVVAFEKRLARVSKSSEELSRDVALYYNPVSVDEADKLSPNFPWSAFFESQGVQKPAMFSLAMPGFHQELSKMLADVPADQWQSYLRFHLVDGASPYL
ncbi:MAG: M13 family metallopeptidase N-terminal domain-containing protein, partial [Pseudomonadota bacterium]|nr:M13 family metallopeptidase N-terminal domain-containing protein [Pseudomonadota bacterium]